MNTVECNGLCVYASDLIDRVNGDVVAYPHDQCPLHGIGHLEQPTPTEWNRDAQDSECDGLQRTHTGEAA